MAENSGGRADKLGNIYERLWAAHQALLVLEGGDHVSLRWEALGDDERGVDLWVELKSGVREAHQCKRQNGSKGRWVLGDLARLGVLVAAKDQLSRDVCHRYVLVSADRAPELHELSSCARTCNNDIHLFSRYQLNNQRRRDAFDYLCEKWGLSRGRADDLQKALGWLQRIECRVFDVEITETTNVERLARRLVRGEPSLVLGALYQMLESNFGNDLRESSISHHLRARGLEVRDLSRDPTLSAAVDRRRARFAESFEHLLIDGVVLPRPETESIARMIEAGDGPRLIWVHGNAGAGKSGVLYELATKLAQNEIPHLPLRLDRIAPAQDPEHLGRDCGLPASPALSLAALAGARTSVLILDQLDAIRWSGAHQGNGWDVCKEVVAEALQLPKMRVVIACRTFDLHEPEVQHWRQRYAAASEQLVGDLSDDILTRVLAKRNVVAATLTAGERALLRTPQWLYLWWEMHKDGGVTRCFSSQATLMREFWKDRWRRIERMDVPTGDVAGVLDVLAEHMDRKGTLRTPLSIISPRYSRALDALCSLHVLTRDATHLFFTHQSHADHLIAERVRAEIAQERRNPLDWVRNHDQSLFRRAQLRHVLTLLRDEDHDKYTKTIRSLLLDEGIRFHLRHLVLRLLGTWSTARASEVDLLVELYRAPQWQEHVLREVLFISETFFAALVERGFFQSELASGDESRINVVLNIMRAMGTRLRNHADTLLDPYWDAEGPWEMRIRSLLPYLADDDMGKMFAFRLKHVRRDRDLLHFSEQWAASEPERCLSLMCAYVESYIADCRRFRSAAVSGEPPRWPTYTKDLMKAAARACDAEPLKAWKALATCVEMLGELRRPRRWSSSSTKLRRVNDGGMSDYYYRQGMSQASAFLRKLLVVAGRKLAATRPRTFAHVVAPYLTTKSLTMRRALLASVRRGGRRLADFGLHWLCEMPQFLRAGPRREGSRWEPAYRTIRRLAPLCSNATYQKLEECVLSYREPDELASCRNKLERARAGFPIRPNRVGMAQNVLLAALPSQRMSVRARAMAGVWREKFGAPTFPRREPAEFRAVVSPIPQQSLHLLSDQHWLKLVSRPESRDLRWLWRPRSETIIKASPEQFARDLAEMTKRQPRRFADLALRLPASAPAIYLGMILSNLNSDKPPPPGTPGADEWAPATQAQLEMLLGRVGYSMDYTSATGFCDVIEARPATRWSNVALEQLIRYATEHPSPESVPVDGELTMTEFNSVRGRAAHAIANLLFEQPSLLARLLPAVERLVRDANPAIRLAAVRACGPILNIDRDLAVTLFLEACEGSECKIASEHISHHFIRYARLTHWQRLVPLIQGMVDSSHAETAEQGAAWMVLTSLEAGLGPSDIASYLAGAVSHRKGCAVAAAALVGDSARTAVFREIMLVLFDDEVEEVRKEACAIFRGSELYAQAGFEVFAEKYARTRAFLDEPWSLLRGIASYSGGLARFAKVIFEISVVISEAWARRAPRQRDSFTVDDLATVLLRLYEQSQDAADRATQVKCLDAWDMLLERGVGGTRRQLAELDG